MLTMTTSMSLVSIAVPGYVKGKFTLCKGPVKNCAHICNWERLADNVIDRFKDLFALLLKGFEVLFIEFIESFDLFLHFCEKVVLCS